jgi:hypothetical protein
MPRWLAVTLAAGLAFWTASIWMSYVQFGGALLWPDFQAALPRFTGLVLHRWLLDLGLALLLAFAAYVHGTSILKRASLDSRGAERILIGTGLGFAGLILAASVMGFVHLFRPGPLRVLMVLFFLTGLWQSRFWQWQMRRMKTETKPEWTSLAPLLLTGAFVAITLFAAAAPETSYDALSWHLPSARFFLQQGKFSFMELYRSNVPEYGTVLFALGLAIHKTDMAGEPAAHMLNFLMLPGIALAGAALVSRIFAREAVRDDEATSQRATLLPQSLAALWIVSSPVVMHRAATCYPDLGASLWGLLAVIALLQFQAAPVQSKQRRAWVVLCGLFAGMAAGSKFVGFYWIALLGLLVTIVTLVLENRRAALRIAATFAVVSGTVCAPWLIRNWIYTGDPVVPMLQKYLPHPSWDVQEVANTLNDANNFSRIPATPANFLALPWRLTMEGDRWQGTIGPVFLWLAPFVLLGVRRNRAWWWIGGILLAFTALWLKGPQWARYYIPAVPLIASLGAVGLCSARLPRWLRASALVASMLLTLVNIPGLNQSWISGGPYVLQEIPWDVAIGPQTPDIYRRIQIPDATAAVFLNAHASPSDRAILAVPVLHFFPPWLTRFKVLDVWENSQAVCPDSNRNLAGRCYYISGPTLFGNLNRLRVDILAIRRNENWSANRDALRLEDPFLRRHFRLLGYVGGTFLYERDPAVPEPGLVYVNADLMSRWVRREGAGSAGDVESSERGPAEADGRYAMQFSGKSSAWFDVELADHPRLSFSATQDLRYFQPVPGTLSVSVGGREVSQTYLSSEAVTHQWQEFNIDLAEFAGKSVHIEMRLAPQNAGEKPTLAIADPVIYAQETTAPVPEGGERWLFNTATRRHPVTVEFSPNPVQPGRSYQIEIRELAGQSVDLLYSFNGSEPIETLRFRSLDARGHVTVPVPGNFSPSPSTIELRGVRRSGDTLWLAASGKLEVRK